MRCPACGADATGAFCGHCGTRVSAVLACRRCGSELPSGARFCVQCGAPARASGTTRASRFVPVIGIALVALVAAFWLGSRTTAEEPARSGVALTAASSPATRTPPPLTGSMREQADRLFERIMQARARGDREEVRFFLPMGIQAYRASDPDPDGLFHLGLLQIESGAHGDARATAARIASLDGEHLFASALGGDAALAAGDTAAARAAFAAFLEDYDEQVGRSLPEYGMHRPALEEYREQARRLLGD